jgi:hypothetical protein
VSQLNFNAFHKFIFAFEDNLGMDSSVSEQIPEVQQILHFSSF